MPRKSPSKEVVARESDAAELAEKAEAEMTMHADLVIQFGVRLPEFLCIVGALQLVMRHPYFAHQPSASVVREVIDGSIAGLRARGLDGTAALMERGNDPRCDVPVEFPSATGAVN